MTEYYFKHIAGKHYEITKMDPNKGIPLDTYDIAGTTCDCPAGSYGRPCKHLTMLQEWLQQEDPPKTFYDDELRRWSIHPFTPDDLTEFLEAHRP